MNTVPRILLIEDDTRLAELIRAYLSQHGFSVGIESHGDAGLGRIVEDQPDLVLLDLMLPGLDGLAVCRMARARYAGPIIMLTAREDDVDQVVGLELGADDYVKKPVEPRVLLARIRAVLRRAATDRELGGDGAEDNGDVLIHGALRLDRSARSATLGGAAVELTSNEFALLWILASHGGKAVDRETLLRQTRGVAYDGLDRSVDIAVSRLRKKLGDNPARPWRIKTVWGMGYLFVRDAWENDGPGAGQ